jgi:hypothetical protein
MHREENVSPFIKCIVRLRDMDLSRESFIHFPLLENVTDQHNKDTNGKWRAGQTNPHGPTDVVVLHHHRSRSSKEYIANQMRGRADKDWKKGGLNQLLREARTGKDAKSESKFFDDSACKAMKKHVPKYAVFDGVLS